MWVSPFRHLRIKGYLLLPVAFRSLSRLSSALSAKASTLRSFLLDLVYSFYSVRNWVFAFNNADRIASILNFRSFGLVVNFVYDILGCLDKKSFHQNLLYEVFKVHPCFRNNLLHLLHFWSYRPCHPRIFILRSNHR